MALFVPFGLLVSTSAPRTSPWTVIGLVCLVSELVQLGIPSRVPTVADLVANTAGTALGYVVVLWWRMSRRDRAAV